jgi:NTP pyrophosphatase (non-canonical NTP hydrolase)
MDLDDYQNNALTTLLYASEEHLTYGLAAEVGEVMALMQKAARHDPRYWNDEADRFFGDYTPLFKEKIFAELGDVLWYLSCLASHHGFPMNAVARHNLEKLGKRKADGTIQGNGDNR